ncbi:hypothetical protein J1N35_000424 [Gossypium stocksii]|uniref:Uncharacterized protein n=1 Tax=Gossypium stocksii TaxID=47602 RepID=A0A9D4AKH7_9ROSI|nr:hypothetical protein J1N35_000424 [Gossypium stocksii]
MANGVAHFLATEGLNKGEQLYLQNEVLEYVMLVLDNDQRWVRTSTKPLLVERLEVD